MREAAKDCPKLELTLLVFVCVEWCGGAGTLDIPFLTRIVNTEDVDNFIFLRLMTKT